MDEGLKIIKIDNEFKQLCMGKTCEFEYQGRRCESTKIVGMARGRLLCRTHFRTIVKDNVRLMRKNKEIPEDLIFTKELGSADTWSRPDLTKLTGGNNGN